MVWVVSTTRKLVMDLYELVRGDSRNLVIGAFTRLLFLEFNGRGAI